MYSSSVEGLLVSLTLPILRSLPRSPCFCIGLASAIRLKQLCQKNETDISVCVLEKGSYVGAHILSGNVFEPRALNELFPDWKDMGAPLNTRVKSDELKILWNQTSSFTVPNMFLPKSIDNHGNYIISLSELCVWLNEKAEEMGVEVLPGFSGDSVIEEDGIIQGVVTGSFGIAKDGSKKDNYMPGRKILAKQTIFTEGARGSLTEHLKGRFQLDKNTTSL